MRWDAVILAGGRASRLGGIDKTALAVQGRSLLDRAVDATGGARARVIVGPTSAGGLPSVLEEPRWGGPALGLAVGLAALPGGAPYVAVVAADQPAVVAGLREVLGGATEGERTDGWVAVDPDGRTQPLLAVYCRAALEAAVEALKREDALVGASLRRLLRDLALTEVPLPAALCRDVDTPEDLLAWRLDAAGGAAERSVA